MASRITKRLSRVRGDSSYSGDVSPVSASRRRLEHGTGPVDLNEPQSCISSASFWTPQHIVESAWLEHAPFAFWLVETLRPRCVVELGTHFGFSFLTFCQAVRRLGIPTVCYAVDTWKGDEHSGFYGEDVYVGLAGIIEQQYSDFARLLRYRFKDALPRIEEASVDLLHIDGRHTYDDVKEDFETWQSRLSDRGVVLFHDTTVRERDFGVWRLWAEEFKRYPAFQFLHCHGLGILATGPAAEQLLRPLLQSGPTGAGMIRAAYARLGQALSLQYQLGVAHQQAQEALGGQARLRAELTSHAAAEQQRLRAELAAQAAAEQERLRAELAGQAAAEQERLRAELAGQAAAEQERLRAELAAQAAAEQERLRSELASQAAAEREKSWAAWTAQAAVSEERLRSQLAARSADELSSLASSVTRLVDEQRAARAALRKWERTVRKRLPRPLGKRLVRTTKALGRVTWRFGRKLSKKVRGGVRAMLRPGRTPHGSLQSPSSPVSEPGAVGEGHAGLLPPAHYLAFQPGELLGAADAPAHRRGRYALTERAGGYVYTPPRRPADLELRLALLARVPRFSIVVPVYNTSTDFLARMLASVQAQWYPFWELVVVDDASPSQDTCGFLEQIKDSRVKVHSLAQNVGISGATNAALELATGEFVVFLDHDDELTEDCLYEIALCVDRDDPDFIYSDEDKISPKGLFVEPFFKPDWSPDTMMSIMYTCHVGCMRLSTLREAGPLASEYDGAQDWDLVLRVTERTNRIVHIPKVLYHWRMIPSSISASIDAKPHAVGASVRLREAALRRRGLHGNFEPVDGLPSCHRVRYFSVGDPLVSIIVPSRDNGTVLHSCISSVVKHSVWQKMEFIVVDNGSRDHETLVSLARLGSEFDCRVIRHDADFNFSELCNVGARAANGQLLLFLNDDTELRSADAIARMAGYAQLHHIGAVGAKLLYPDTYQIQHAGIINLSCGPGHALARLSGAVHGYFLRNTVEYNWIAVTGACLMIQRDRFELVGFFDESLPIAYNDVELCMRLIKRGLYNVVCPMAEWIHHEFT